MFDFNLLAESEKHKEDLQTDRYERFDWYFQKALGSLARFNQHNAFGLQDLQAAVSDLLQAVTYRRNQAKAYAWLAYALFVSGKPLLALRYLKLAREIGPDDPLTLRLSDYFQHH